MDTRPIVTLDGFVDITEAVDGVDVHRLEPLTRVFVRTCNSDYRLIVSSDGGVLVQGGRFFEQLDMEGIFFCCSRVRMAEITDGTSNTFMVGESKAETFSQDGNQMDFWYIG